MSQKGRILQFQNAGNARESILSVCAKGSKDDKYARGGCDGRFILLPYFMGECKSLTTRPVGTRDRSKSCIEYMYEEDFVRLQWEEMTGMRKETIRLVLVSDSESLPYG